MKTDLIKKAEKQILELFKHDLPESNLYHNYLHTSRVVEACMKIGEYYKLDNDDMEALLLAAWFHDSGFIDGPDGHEEKSCSLARTFLTEEEVPAKTIELVEDIITATKPQQQPKTLLQEIIKDADNVHVAKKYFEEASELLRQEEKLLGVSDLSASQWRAATIELFTEKHRYYTDYAIKNWKQRKHKNLLKLFKKDKKVKRKKNEAKIKAKFKNESPERGIQTMFRVALRNHIKLSDIADTKANILLSVNAIIISLALANLIPKLDSPNNKHLLIPSLILVLFSVASIIMSILSTSPKVDKGEFTEEDVKKRRVNLLFFGNFHKMDYKKYEWAIDQIIDDKSYVYHSLTKDLHSLGVVLKKKYRLLKITYMVFMVGIICSVIAFIIAFSQL
ncbi:Pycsar system effector family protein [Sungkyunkwania multivorans]|uniref:Pycsar system effector family protein n=1 Tax=Sungkyunkwania multivorans TaxID=1173618 RepID=A0ABW3CVJ7_9FLAO